jgi:hypothetical protein
MLCATFGGGVAAALLVGSGLLLPAVATADPPPTGNETWMELHLMNTSADDGGGAAAAPRCLDGTPGGFYLDVPGDRTHGPADPLAFHIHFEGGGWCYSNDECETRAHTMGTGGSGTWPTRLRGRDGLFSDDPVVSPAFAGMTRVFAKYCDGGSWSGLLTPPYDSPNGTLFFRGRSLLDSLLATLSSKHGLRDAHTVLVSGDSAGGLTALLQADYIGEQLRAKHAPLMKTYAAVAVSGYFLWAPSLLDQQIYPDEMTRIFARGNATNGVNAACIAATPAADAARCMSAQASWEHMVTPTMLINSAFDQWQTSCILAAVPEADAHLPQTQYDLGCSGVEGWWEGQCGYETDGMPTSACNATQMQKIVGYQELFHRTVQGSAAYLKPKFGSFITSCYDHCGAMGDTPMMERKVGGVAMNVAVEKWWKAQLPGGDKAGAGVGAGVDGGHHYADCIWSKAGEPCNPTC